VEPLPLFEIKNLTYYYPETARPALQNIHLAIEEGEFVLVVGGSGSGKSSLARALTGLIPDFYGGRIGGQVLLKGQNIQTLDRRQIAGTVGMVFQDPEQQLVMTGVQAEIAFGLENLGLPPAEMFRRVAEVVSFLNLTPIKLSFTAGLSGGQKQKLALASILAMQPGVLILDEPTSQLDPAAAEEFFNLIKRLNEEMNFTIILVEQRLERCFHLADRVLVMENGSIVQDGSPAAAAAWQCARGLPFVPPVAALFARAGSPSVPLTVKEGRLLVKKMFYRSTPAEISLDNAKQERPADRTPVIDVEDLWFSYPNGNEVLHGVDLKVYSGEFVALLGENAAGKTTLLKHLVGLLKPDRGRVRILERDTRRTTPQELAHFVGYLSQNPNDYLFQATVADELRFTLTNLGLAEGDRIDRVLEKLALESFRAANPRDLSSGERQRVALASVMVAKPQLLVLDEPTRGLDYGLKERLGRLLRAIAAEGTTILVVTHDVEFAAEYARRAVMLFDGRIAADGPKQQILGGSMFYAPQISRLFRHIDDQVFTFEEGLTRLRQAQGNL
jgi:energy-coupling factor transporter ATP-binding protein EcfA2